MALQNDCSENKECLRTKNVNIVYTSGKYEPFLNETSDILPMSVCLMQNN